MRARSMVLGVNEPQVSILPWICGGCTPSSDMLDGGGRWDGGVSW